MFCAQINTTKHALVYLNAPSGATDPSPPPPFSAPRTRTFRLFSAPMDDEAKAKAHIYIEIGDAGWSGLAEGKNSQ